MTTTQCHYIYPPRATDAIPKNEAIKFYTEVNWIAELKYNDTHILIEYLDQDAQRDTGIELPYLIWDRHAKHTQIPPVLHQELHELHAILQDSGLAHDARWLLDGGLLHNKHSAIKNTIVIWDILVSAGHYQLGTTYGQRYQQLYELTAHYASTHAAQDTHYIYECGADAIDLGTRLTQNIIIPHLLSPDTWLAAWDELEAINKHYLQPLVEGLVFKNPAGKLKPGYNERNNSDWMGRSRVTTGRHKF